MRIMTIILLPPGPITDATMESLLRMILTELKWINPDQFGHIEANEPLNTDSDKVRLDILLESYRRHQDLELHQRKGNITISIVPDKDAERSFSGYILWVGPSNAPCLKQSSHRDSVWRVMKLVGAPLAVAMETQAYDEFRWRTVELDIGEELVLTVRDYSEGLEHAHWRMWFAEPYVSFFGQDVLAKAPAVISQPLDGGGYFVQVLEKPEDWDQPAGQQAVTQFVTSLGKQAFYDPTHPEQTLEAPDFTNLHKRLNELQEE